ncbi:MAG: hypothetical protein CL681_01460 [Blastopirellula sp.]|nr:hypothetical protein [Blastopirellula sp.]
MDFQRYRFLSDVSDYNSRMFASLLAAVSPSNSLGHRMAWLAVWLVVACALRVVEVDAEEKAFADSWKRNGLATPVFEINGTEGRNNPIRRRLKKPLAADDVYVRYRIRYQQDSVDTPTEDEGEFVVLWLDQAEGNDASQHNGGVPNVGIHVAGDKNRFMVRFASGKERFGTELTGGRDFLVVARLWKSRPGVDEPFDQLNLWVNPQEDAETKPEASVESGKSITQVQWIGFATGGKTELEDRIFVWDVGVASSWREILGLPPKAATEPHSPVTVTKRTIDFDKHVYPVLKAKCFSCHAGDDAEVRLDVQDEVLNRCQPGNADASPLFQMVAQHKMPPEDAPPLSEDELGVLRRWIDEGVLWNEERLPVPQPQTQHWAFQPVVRPKIPTVTRKGWVQTPVDAFIARQQEAQGIFPAPPADRRTLARRMSLDMHGLPNDKTDVTVDALLQHPAYGQRWGRHWLDVARWAESNGHQHNRFRPHAWRYRDWVVEAFHQDLPFDQFLTAQIAGDELAPTSVENDNRHLVATGFLAAARYSGNELDKRIQRNDILVDLVNTTASAFLGMTIGCAQCHSHKFDPISIRDYYRMQAFFATGQPGNLGLTSDQEASAVLVQKRWEIYDRTFERLVKIRRRKGEPNPELVTPNTVVSKMRPEDRKQFNALEQQIAELQQTWGFYSSATAPQQRNRLPHAMRWPLPRDPEVTGTLATRILLRGDVNAPGPTVQAGWPLVFGRTGQVGAQPRIALAEWMVGDKNPLTARVWVNRIWYWHFGQGLVASVSDFGHQGTPPTHPQLLDFLAAELMENDWRTSHIHRLILDSATYQQSSRYASENAALDPQNRTYWRWVPRRLEAEAIRDCMLSVAGQLDSTIGGPSDAAHQDSRRRSLYLRQHRERLPVQQQLFDGAEGVVSCARRNVSTNALQPLWLLNSKLSQQVAQALATRAGTVENAFRRCLGRDPSPEQLQSLRMHAERHGLVSACLVIINSSEFLYIP